MNREEAQFILRAYRANGSDAPDPQFAEALELARQDPELARWLAEEQALDAATARALRSVQPPPSLRAQLLAARKILRPAPWWRPPAWLAAAASILLLLWLGNALRTRPPQTTAGNPLDALRQEAVRASLDLVGHIEETGLDAAQMKRWLAEQRGETNYVLPRGLSGQRVIGCKVLHWRGHRLTLLCFKPNSDHIDIVVVNAADFPGLRVGPAPEFAEEGGLTTASWVQDGRLYVMAAARPRDTLARYL